MKKYSLYIILFFALSTTVQAQFPPGFVLLKKFTIKVTPVTCYQKSDYPLLDNVLDDLLEQKLGYTFCLANCPFQPLPSCTAILLNEDEVVTENATEWCLFGTMLFQWLCGPMPVPTNPVLPFDQIVIDGIFDIPADDLSKPIDKGASIYRIFPNPSQGKLLLTLSDHRSFSKPLLQLTDWSGRKIKTIALDQDMLEEKQLELDLMDQPSGVYFITIYSEHKKVQTEKIIIQK